MIDPTFATDAELHAWAAKRAAKAFSPKQKLAALTEIRRATMAHLKQKTRENEPFSFTPSANMSK